MTVPIMQTGTVAHVDACFIVVIQLNTQQKRCLYPTQAAELQPAEAHWNHSASIDYLEGNLLLKRCPIS